MKTKTHHLEVYVKMNRNKRTIELIRFLGWSTGINNDEANLMRDQAIKSLEKIWIKAKV